MIQNFYAGIGSRATPAHMLTAMTDLAAYLAQNDFILRSGGAQGADLAFEFGCDREGGEKEIFIPWNGFNSRIATNDSVVVGVSIEALELSKKFHPAWDACSTAAKCLHARNAYQVLGQDLKTPSQFVLCWTPGGHGGGGTGQAIRIARANNIPVFDLGSSNVLQDLDSYLNSLG